MAHYSPGSLESIMMKNQNGAAGAHHHGSSTLGNLQSIMKNQFDLLGEDEYEEPTSVLDLTQCISPPLQPDVWAQQQAAMEYDQQQSQIMWEQQQIFLWQQQQNQGLWEQQQLSMWEQQQVDNELQYLQSMTSPGTGGIDDQMMVHSWDDQTVSYPCSTDLSELEHTMMHPDPWLNSPLEFHQDHVFGAQLQGLPPLDDPLILENWIACSGDSSTVTSVSDESSTPYLMTDDLESAVSGEQQQQEQQQQQHHHHQQQQQQQQQQQLQKSNSFGQAGNGTVQHHTQPQLELEIPMDSSEALQLQEMSNNICNNFNSPISTDFHSTMEDIKPSAASNNWSFLPPMHHANDHLQQTSSPSSRSVPQQERTQRTLQTVQTVTPTRPVMNHSPPPHSQYQMPIQTLPGYTRGDNSITNHQMQQQQQPNTNFLEEVPQLQQRGTDNFKASFYECKPVPIAKVTQVPEPSFITPSATSPSTVNSTKLWGPHRPASHGAPNNHYAKPVSESTVVTSVSRRRSASDAMADQKTGHGHAQMQGKVAMQKTGHNTTVGSNNSSSASRGSFGSQSTGSGRVVTLAELASGGVKMGGVQLPTVGTQIPSVVRLAVETQASGMGGVRMVQLLLACAEAVACRDSRQANILLQQLQHMASPYGDAMQRITACFVEGLTARLAITGSQPFKFTNPPRKPPSEPEKLEGFNLVYQSSPYVAFGHFAANSAILEAFEGEETMHIVDLGMTHALQWPYLIHGLAKRPGGPPRLLRITGFGLATESMNEAGEELARIAKEVNVPFEFRAVTETLEGLKRSMLQLREGEALAVNSVLQLHCVVKESRGSLNAVLQSIHELSPKILTLVEQDASHNGPFFLGRFMEALHYYSAIFDSLDAILPRNSKPRVKMEQFHFAEEIKNIVSCEGPARVERHERVDQWRRRMSRAGFQPLPLKFLSQARMWLGQYSCEGYTLSEEKGCLVLGWKGKPIIAASSWKK